MILFGASGHCKVILDILKLNNIEVEAIYDDSPILENIFDIPVIKNNLDRNQVFEVIISIGSNAVRKKIVENYNFVYSEAIHPSAIVAKSSNVGEGTVIMANAVINADSNVGKHCIINTSAVVEHDCSIGDYVHISPNASLAGNVSIGEGTHVGIGASIIQGIKIGRWAVIGAGAVIIKDVPDGATVVGNPGKIIKVKKI